MTLSTRRRGVPVLALAVVVLPASLASAGGDPVEGGRIARRWCTTCHVVEASAVTGADATPPLPAVRRDPAMTPERLKAFLTRPHGGMEGMSFSRREIDDLLAYIDDVAR